MVLARGPSTLTGVVLALAVLAPGCAWLGQALSGEPAEDRAEARAAEQQRREQDQARLDRELGEQAQAVIDEAAAEGVTSTRALSLAELTIKAHRTGAIGRPHIDGPVLVLATLEQLAAAIEVEPDEAAPLHRAVGDIHALQGQADEAAAAYSASLAAAARMPTFLAMLSLPRTPAVNAVVLEACPTMRAQVTVVEVPDFVQSCLAAAEGDSSRLVWKDVQQDLVAYEREMVRREEEQRRLEEEEKRRAEEEQQRRAEEEAARAEEEAERARHAIAAVFAAGDCSFGDCMHQGWEVRTDKGTVRVTCNFGECATKGWEARFPDGGTARTSCNFGECLTKGWETRFPDGQTARTSCNFGDCATKGWETRLPDGGTARTSCNFGECYTKGWETRLPDGTTVRCSCDFGDCLQKGTDCR